MPGFIQVIDYHTSKYDEGEKIVDEWRSRTEGKRTAVRAMTLQDREDPTHYLQIVEFGSYEEAMKNSELPETQELSGKLAALADSQSFGNFDIVRTEEL